MEYFDKIVYYQICDFFYDEFNNLKDNHKGIGYQTFTNMCNIYSKKIKSGISFNKHEMLIITKIMDRTCNFFGFNDEKAIIYICDFLDGEYWVKYHQSVSSNNTMFYHSKNIYNKTSELPNL
jgi:hypothetical protein